MDMANHSAIMPSSSAGSDITESGSSIRKLSIQRHGGTTWISIESPGSSKSGGSSVGSSKTVGSSVGSSNTIGSSESDIGNKKSLLESLKKTIITVEPGSKLNSIIDALESTINAIAPSQSKKRSKKRPGSPLESLFSKRRRISESSEYISLEVEKASQEKVKMDLKLLFSPVKKVSTDLLSILEFPEAECQFESQSQQSQLEYQSSEKPGSLIASKHQASQKLGMLYLSRGKHYKEMRLYFLDDMYSTGGDGDGDTKFGHIEPRVQIQFDLGNCDKSAICFVDSTLYLFDGFDPTMLKARTPRRSASKCVLSMGKLEKICDMTHSKWWPVAIPTPDHKSILVFSSNLLDRYSNFDFEMYDIRKNSWETLPGLPIRPLSKHSYRWAHRVRSYTFLDDSRFLVETTDGTFTLNLQSKKWSLISNWYPWGWGRFISLRGGRIAVIPRGVFESVNHERLISDVGVEGPRDYDPYRDLCGYMVRSSDAHLSKFPPTDPPDLYDSLLLSPSIASLHMEEDRVLKTGTLQAQEDGSGGARVLIDVSRVDLNTLKMEVVHTIRAHLDNVPVLPIFIDLFPL